MSYKDVEVPPITPIGERFIRLVQVDGERIDVTDHHDRMVTVNAPITPQLGHRLLAAAHILKVELILLGCTSDSTTFNLGRR